MVAAETDKPGCGVDSRSVLELLLALLGDPARRDRDSTLESLGVDDEGLVALWSAVCEEFGEPSLGQELEPGVLEVSMTLEGASAVMAKLLETKRNSVD